MLRVFQNDLADLKRFIITLELVPGRESTGRSVELVKKIAADAYSDGRVSAVSVTDNPGGNPALSPDAIGYDIFKLGMDVIVHFTCRDMNRVGMESRALQLAMMGMKNILALTGDYTGKGFCGEGAPVFDLDSVNLISMLGMLGERMEKSGDPDPFFIGCAVSPFKYTEGESFTQYAKLCRKANAGARFIITQLGYDAQKFSELLDIQGKMGISIPVIGSVYLLTPNTARLMHEGRIPGAVVSRVLMERVVSEWKDQASGRAASIERAARLGAVLKGLGYRGIHIGGIHRDFGMAARLIDRMTELEKNWHDFIPEFCDMSGTCEESKYMKKNGGREKPGALESTHYRLMRFAHKTGFKSDAPLGPLFRSAGGVLDRTGAGRKIIYLAEDMPKSIFLGCRKCGDCAIQHVGFLCPESGCPKHIRNGACGGSRDGFCEVNKERLCIWYRAWRRFASSGEASLMVKGLVPPRMWALDGTSSWLNFHLGRDHQGKGGCLKETGSCRI
jgi:methylenetetrahydrofolate reductase (NADPH)